MPTPFYTGNDVPLEFNVTDKNGNVNPSSAVVDIIDPLGVKIITDDAATVSGNTVTYTVAGSNTNATGVYIAEFDVTLPGGPVRGHMILFAIKARPTNQ